MVGFIHAIEDGTIAAMKTYLIIALAVFSLVASAMSILGFKYAKDAH